MCDGWIDRRTLVNGSHDFGKTGDAIARNIAMVGQRVKTRARAAHVSSTSFGKGMFTRDVDGLGEVDDEALGLLVVVDGADGGAQLLGRQTVEIAGVVERRKGIDEAAAQR